MQFVENIIKPFVEKHSFGVCSYLAQKWRLDESKVRLYFIYSSFATFGSPVIFYLFAAFWLNIKKYIRSGIALK